MTSEWCARVRRRVDWECNKMNPPIIFLSYVPPIQVYYALPLSSRDLSNCHQSRVRLFPASLCQALSSLTLSGSSSLTPIHNRPLNCQALSGSFQPHSRPLALLSSHPPCHSPSRSMSLSLAINLSHSVAYATLSQDGALCLLSLLSLLATHLLIPTPWHTLAFSHSLRLCIALTHVVLFSHVVALSF